VPLLLEASGGAEGGSCKACWWESIASGAKEAAQKDEALQEKRKAALRGRSHDAEECGEQVVDNKTEGCKRLVRMRRRRRRNAALRLRSSGRKAVPPQTILEWL
jgi:hypothetical protein